MATQTSVEEGIHALLITKNELINAPMEIVFQSILEELGSENRGNDGSPLSMKIEPWPGGRWFRDLGKNDGHLWGHVQVMKAPYLLEITGPFFMSYPAVNHLQYRLAIEGNATRLQFVHRAIGQIPSEHREGVTKGWGEIIQRIQTSAEKKAKG